MSCIVNALDFASRAAYRIVLVPDAAYRAVCLIGHVPDANSRAAYHIVHDLDVVSRCVYHTRVKTLLNKNHASRVGERNKQTRWLTTNVQHMHFYNPTSLPTLCYGHH